MVFEFLDIVNIDYDGVVIQLKVTLIALTMHVTKNYRILEKYPHFHVDRMSLYNGYFAQGYGLDPSGLFLYLLGILPKEAILELEKYGNVIGSAFGEIDEEQFSLYGEIDDFIEHLRIAENAERLKEGQSTSKD